jgi:hypothetical protein
VRPPIRRSSERAFSDQTYIRYISRLGRWLDGYDSPPTAARAAVPTASATEVEVESYPWDDNAVRRVAPEECSPVLERA